MGFLGDIDGWGNQQTGGQQSWGGSGGFLGGLFGNQQAWGSPDTGTGTAGVGTAGLDPGGAGGAGGPANPLQWLLGQLGQQPNNPQQNTGWNQVANGTSSIQLPGMNQTGTGVLGQPTYGWGGPQAGGSSDGATGSTGVNGLFGSQQPQQQPQIQAIIDALRGGQGAGMGAM